MDELHKTAEAYYNVSTENIKKRANEFFREMDQNDDGQVSLQEYLAFMKNQRYTNMNNPYFFKKLSKQGNDETYLTFLEVMTLFYIIESGRPFCDGCGDFISGMFFTCVECFESKRSTFNVCVDCFICGNYVHNHKDFMDNFLLLESKRKVGVEGGKSGTREMEVTKNYFIANFV